MSPFDFSAMNKRAGAQQDNVLIVLHEHSSGEIRHVLVPRGMFAAQVREHLIANDIILPYQFIREIPLRETKTIGEFVEKHGENLTLETIARPRRSEMCELYGCPKAAALAERRDIMPVKTEVVRFG